MEEDKANSVLPPLPEGFTLDEPQADVKNDLPPLPEGFSLDEPEAPSTGSSGYSGEGSFINMGVPVDDGYVRVMNDGTKTADTEDDFVKSQDELYGSIRNNPKYKELNEFENSWGHTLFNFKTENAETGDSHVYSPLTGGMPTHLQELRKLRDKEMKDVYERTGYQSGGIRVQESVTDNPYFDPKKGPGPENEPMRTNRYVVDGPERTAIDRVAYNTFRNIVGGLGDLAITGVHGTITNDPSKIKISQDGPVSDLLPPAVQDSGTEQFATELATFALGPLGVAKGIGWGMKGVEAAEAGLAAQIGKRMSPATIEKAQDIYKASVGKIGEQAAVQRVANFMKVATVGMGLGLTEAVVAPRDSESLTEAVMGNEFLQKKFNLSPERARDMGMILEGPAVGAVLSSLGRAWGQVRDRAILPAVGGIRGMNVMGLQGSSILRMTEREAGLATMSWLDRNLVNSTPEEAATRIKLMGDRLAANAKTNLKLAEAGRAQDLDSPSAFVGVAHDYYRVAYQNKRDEMGAEAFEKWVDQQAKETAERMIELRTSLTPQNSELSNKTANNIGSLRELFYEGADTMTEAGTPKAQVDAGKVIFDDATAKRNAREGNIETARVDAEGARSAADNAISDDERFRLFMDESTDGLDTEGPIRDILDRIDTKTYAAFNKGKDKVNAAYDAIAETGAVIDQDSFLNIIKEKAATPVKTSTGDKKLDETLMSDPEARAMYEKLNGPIPTTGGEQTHTINSEFFKGIAEDVIDDPSIGNVYNNVRQKINKEAKRLAGKTNRTDAQDRELEALRDLQKNINETQMDYISRDNPEIKGLVDTARTEYRNLRDTFYGNDGISRVSEDMLERRNADPARGSKMDVGFDGTPQKQSNAKIELARHVMSALPGHQGREFTRVLTNGTKWGENDITPDLRDLYVTKGLMNLSNAITSGSKQSVGTLRSAFSQVKGPLKDLDSPMLKEIERMEAKIEGLENMAGRKEDWYKQVQADMADLERRAGEKILARFLHRGEGQLEGVDVGEQMKTLFKGKNSTTELKTLLNEIDSIGPDAEVVKDALKSTYTRDIFDRLQSRRSVGVSGINDGAIEDAFLLNSSTFDKVFQPNSRDRANLELLFKDSPETVDEIEKAAKIYQNLSKKSGRGSGSILGELPKNLDPSHATNTMIYLAFGQLSRAGATARRFTAPMAVDRLDQVRAAAQGTLIAMVTDPKEFQRIANLIHSGRANDEAVKAANALFTRANIRTLLTQTEDREDTPAKAPDLKAETESLFGNKSVDTSRPIIENDDRKKKDSSLWENREYLKSMTPPW